MTPGMSQVIAAGTLDIIFPLPDTYRNVVILIDLLISSIAMMQEGTMCNVSPKGDGCSACEYC